MQQLGDVLRVLVKELDAHLQDAVMDHENIRVQVSSIKQELHQMTLCNLFVWYGFPVMLRGLKTLSVEY
jgi:hypothetical protein